MAREEKTIRNDGGQMARKKKTIRNDEPTTEPAEDDIPFGAEPEPFEDDGNDGPPDAAAEAFAERVVDQEAIANAVSKIANFFGEAPKKTRYLECILTSEELAEHAQSLVAHHATIDSLNREIESLGARSKLLKKNVDIEVAAASTLAADYRSGVAMRDVECEERQTIEPDVVGREPRVGLMSYRLDTLEAIPGTWREYTRSERQGDLFSAAESVSVAFGDSKVTLTTANGASLRAESAST